MPAETMEPQGRHALIVELSKRLEGVSPEFGKTALMKLLYLLQEAYGVSTGYRYSLYTYGPYSQEVAADLNMTRFLGGVNVEFFGENPGGYQITPGQESGRILSSGRECIDSHSEQLDKLVDLFGGFRTRDLELRTTMVYLWKNFESNAGGDLEEMLGMLRELKPQFSEWEIDAAVEELQGAGIMENIEPKKNAKRKP